VVPFFSSTLGSNSQLNVSRIGSPGVLALQIGTFGYFETPFIPRTGLSRLRILFVNLILKNKIHVKKKINSTRFQIKKLNNMLKVIDYYLTFFS